MIAKPLRQLVLLCIFSSLLLLAAPLSAQNKIEGLRIWPSPNNTRIVFDLENQPEYSYFPLYNPSRLVVDLANTDKNIDLSKYTNTGNLVKKVRHSTPKNNKSTRIVIELTKAVKAEVFALPPTAPYKNRLVIDLTDAKAANVTAVKDSQDNIRDRDIIIALDAGHGGEDPGSIGRAGTFEKNVTLSVSKKLAKTH